MYATLVNHSAWDANHRAVRCNVPQNDRARTNTRVCPYFNCAENLGTCTDHNICRKGGVALAVGFSGASQGDSLIKQALITDYSCFTDYHAHAVVDENAHADPRAGVNLDTC